MTYIDELRDAIRKLHGVEATHIESVPIKETFQGQTIWEGIVDVFELHGHPDAEKAYAWSHDTDDTKKRHVAVLHVGPVTSALTAVRAAIVQEFRDAKQKKPKIGRPVLPRGQSKARIVPVRFRTEDLKRMESAAKANGQKLSEWIRSAVTAAIPQ